MLVLKPACAHLAAVKLPCKEPENSSVELLCCASPALTAHSCLVCRYEELQVYRVLTDSAARLEEVARELTPSFDTASAVGFSAYYMLEAGQPRFMSFAYNMLSKQCSEHWHEMMGLVCPAGGHCRSGVRTHFATPSVLVCKKACQGCCREFAENRGCNRRIMRRASGEFPTEMPIPAACLLLSQYPPAIAQLFVHFRRLQMNLPPDDKRHQMFCENTSGDLTPASLLAAVRHCA